MDPANGGHCTGLGLARDSAGCAITKKNSSAVIQLDNISLNYPGHPEPIHALKNVHLQVRAGEVFGVIGRSGAGKSSLARVINLLNRPSHGRVTVFV
jgi:ABC-type dipeptide/oligopeptide/nickel transport system ATPase subunit